MRRSLRCSFLRAFSRRSKMVPKSNDDFFFVRGDAVDAIPGRFHPTTFKTTNTTTTACPPFFQRRRRPRVVKAMILANTTTKGGVFWWLWCAQKSASSSSSSSSSSPHHFFFVSVSRRRRRLLLLCLLLLLPVIRVPLFFRVVCETQIREHLTKGVVVVQMCETTTYDDEHRQKTHKNTLCTRNNIKP